MNTGTGGTKLGAEGVTNGADGGKMLKLSGICVTWAEIVIFATPCVSVGAAAPGLALVLGLAGSPGVGVLPALMALVMSVAFHLEYLRFSAISSSISPN